MGKKLEIDEEKVLELSKKCPDWKGGLEALFPEAFIPKGPKFDRSKLNLQVWEDGIMLFYGNEFLIFFGPKGIKRMPLSHVSIVEVPFKFTTKIYGDVVEVE